MNIGQAAKRCGLSAKTIRYYEDIDLVVPRRQASNEYRDYSDADVEKLAFLQRARAVGFGLDECRELLNLYQNTGRQASHIKDLVVGKLQQLDQQLEALNEMRATLTEMAARCVGDETPRCAIIESLAHPHSHSHSQPLPEPAKKDAIPAMSFTLVESLGGESS